MRKGRLPPVHGVRGRGQRRRVYSQNFLPEGSHVIDDLISLSEVPEHALIVEIGAGRGVITKKLAESGYQVLAYEIDDTQEKVLESSLKGMKDVRVVYRDVLGCSPPRQPFHVVGNIPFGVTSGILDWCLRSRFFVSATVLVQLEYARKRSGYAGRWSKRTVETWPWYSWTQLGTVPRKEFQPVPSVDAGVLRIARRDEALVPAPSRPHYQRLVALGFSGKGGTLYHSLATQYPRDRVLTALQRAGVRRGVVVAFVSPEQWISIYWSLVGERTGRAPRATRSPGHKPS